MKGDKPALDEIDTIYVEPKERFVVSLLVSYSTRDLKTSTIPARSGWRKPKTAREFALAAAAAALDLTRDDGSSDTVWFVHDRHTKTTHQFEQNEFEEIDTW